MEKALKDRLLARLFHLDKPLASFFSIMKENVISGLYYFQIFRGVLWVLIAYLVLVSTEGTLLRKGLILGLLLSLLGSSQLLLPNPIMPYMVRMGHLVETATSSFIWGFILAWSFEKFTTFLPSNNKIDMNPNIEIAMQK